MHFYNHIVKENFSFQLFIFFWLKYLSEMLPDDRDDDREDPPHYFLPSAEFLLLPVQYIVTKENNICKNYFKDK